VRLLAGFNETQLSVAGFLASLYTMRLVLTRYYIEKLHTVYSMLYKPTLKNNKN